MGIFFRFDIKKSIKLAPIKIKISAMFIKSSLCFTLIAVIIAGNGMARYLLVDVADEKGISHTNQTQNHTHGFPTHECTPIPTAATQFLNFVLMVFVKILVNGVPWILIADALIKIKQDARKEWCVAHVFRV